MNTGHNQNYRPVAEYLEKLGICMSERALLEMQQLLLYSWGCLWYTCCHTPSHLTCSKCFSHRSSVYHDTLISLQILCFLLQGYMCHSFQHLVSLDILRKTFLYHGLSSIDQPFIQQLPWTTLKYQYQKTKSAVQ